MAKAAADNVVSLERYRAKRDFTRSPEPEARAAEAESEGQLFCVQQHAARRMHWDLRLQLGDALKSWAVPEGPSLDPSVRRLAVHVEDHPIDYARFEGVIPKGNYGAGNVIVWDIGRWVPEGDPEAGYRKGSLKFRLVGEKLKGGWTLVRIKGDREKGDNWLLIKKRDLEARPESEGSIVLERPESVLSGRIVTALDDDAEAAEPHPPPPKAKPLRPGALPGAVKAPLPAVPPRPQLATPVSSPPDGGGWLHEIKFDGYRTLARVERGEVRFFTRTGLDWTDRYGALSEPFKKLSCKEAVIDGEIVVQDEKGLTSFAALQEALSDGATHRLTFFAFDLLHLDGCGLCDVPLARRKATLEDVIGPVVGGRSALQYSEHVEGQGRKFFAQCGPMGLEGVVSKKADAPYRAGRTRTWLKAKCVNADEFVIVGYTASEATHGVAALLVADAGEQGLRYAGRVGTGYSRAEGERLLARLSALERKSPPVQLPPEERRKGIVWVKPVLLAEIQYMTRTGDGLLRHAVYRGLREDKVEGGDAPAAEQAANPAPTPRKRLVSEADLAAIWVTNPDRRMFSDDGPTKLQLALYYAQVGDWMLPEIMHRPISLVRSPSGKVGDTFFQRHTMPGMPEAVKTIPMYEEGTKERRPYLYVENARGLLALPQFGAVELHAWGCRIDQPEKPDRIVFDLDPDEGLPWRATVDAAFLVRDALAELGLVPFVKTTGGKGIHVVVPLARRQAWPEVQRFCEAFARMMAKADPKRFTPNMAKKERRGRIFLDWLRNVRGATAVAAYSLRARPGVPASTPLHWDELRAVDDPADLNYATVPERLAADFVDPWAAIEDSARALTKAMQRGVGLGGPAAGRSAEKG